MNRAIQTTIYCSTEAKDNKRKVIRRVVEEEQKVLSSIISFDIARINTKKEKKKNQRFE